MSYGQAAGPHTVALNRVQLVGHRQGLTACQGKALRPGRGVLYMGTTYPSAAYLQCMWGLHKLHCSLCSPHNLDTMHAVWLLLFGG